MTTTGIEAVLHLLAGVGVSHLFGNPGTTELPLNDALARDRRFRYVLGLHEVPVVAMADGFAQASGRLAVANVHTACGLGNAMGMLYNARAAGTPLLLTAGSPDRRLRFEEPVLAGDLATVARPWCKWAAEVSRVEELPSAVRRAVQIALTPPTGPTFLAMPLDVQLEASDRLDLTPIHVPDRRMRPARDALLAAAAVLATAKNPAILAGSRVTAAGAIADLVELAERLGAAVFAESGTSHGRLPFPATHALFAGRLPLWQPEVAAALAEFDVLLLVGLDVLRQYLFLEPARPIPPTVRMIHLDDDAAQIGKNYSVEVGLIGDIREGLAELTTLVPRLPGAEERIAAWGRRRQTDRERLEQTADAEWAHRPISPRAVVRALARSLPADTAVIDEAATTSGGRLERLGGLTDPAGYFGHRGWALGWGLGAALGVKLAWPDRPVLALIGDGAAVYGIQALWTAAHVGIAVTVVVCNNRQYRILKDCGAGVMRLPGMIAGTAAGMDLCPPAVDFVALAHGFGVEACRVESADELSERVRAGLAGDKPVLLEAMIGD